MTRASPSVDPQHHNTHQNCTQQSHSLTTLQFSCSKLNVKINDMSITDLSLMLEKDRVKYNRIKPLSSLSRPVILINEKDSNKTEFFPSLGKCVEYLRSKGLPATQVTLIKCINTDKVYHSYKCKYA